MTAAKSSCLQHARLLYFSGISHTASQKYLD